MTPRTSVQQTERQAARRRTIINEAAKLFDADGFSQTSLDAIASSAGIAKPTLYHYFKGRDEILYEIHADFLDHAMKDLSERRAQNLSPRRTLFGVVVDTISLMATHPGHVRVFVEHYRDLPTPLRARIAKRRDEYFQDVRRVIDEGIEAGEFRAIDSTMATLALFGMCNWSYQWFRADGPRSAEYVANSFWEYFSRGIETEPNQL
jgi:AcrR family transcriptional regulator